MDYLKGIFPFPNMERDGIQINALSSNTILQVANEINSLLVEKELEHDDLILPRIIVVGAQSSGKTSILNNIISMDILPMGEDMVTRVPLELHLHKLPKTNNKNWVEFWDKDTNACVFTMDVSFPITKPESDKIKNTISDETNKFAGLEKNINTKAIVMKIYSPHVPNLSLTDLPGLVMLSCTDKGQPNDLKEKIEKIAREYMDKPKTIILAVAQSKKDLETDIGLHLIKRYSRNNTKIIGVLTKPDLMNRDTHVGNYLNNNISDSLKLNNGYFVVKCRDNNERISMSVTDGYHAETLYFNSNTEYKKQKYKGKIGTNNLVVKLTGILLEDIKTHLPKALLKLVELEKTISCELDKLGNGIPNNPTEKMTILNIYVSKFCQSLVTGMNEGTSSFNAPVTIKAIFSDFRKKLIQLQPSSDKNTYDESYFEKLKSNLEGNHMTSYVSSIKLIEYCIQDNKLKPLDILLEPSYDVTNKVVTCIKELIQSVLTEPQFMKYQRLTLFINNLISDEYLPVLQLNVNQKIKELISCYKCYVWTEDIEFNKLVQTNTPPEILLHKYFATVKYIIQDIIPKYVMLGIVHVITQSMNTYLYDEIINKGKIEYVHEDDEIKSKRDGYVVVLERISNIKKQFDKSISK